MNATSRAIKPLPDLTELTLAQKVAQLVQIDIPDMKLGERTREHFRRYEYNGVILFAKNVADREQVVLKMVAEGYTAPEIGEQLTISPKTVDTYKQRIGEKLGLTHRTDYVKFALRLGLLKNDA